MATLVAACPEFAPQWQEFQDDWRDEPDESPVYVPLAAFARHLIAKLERGETADLPAVFDAVERLHVEGDEFVREAATVGLLEGLQNLNLHSRGTTPEQFRPYLGPQTARWWDKLEAFWERGTPLTDD